MHNHMEWLSEQTANYRIAKGISAEIPAVKDTLSGKKLRSVILYDMKCVYKAYLLAKSKESDNDVLPPLYEWIADNYYILEEEAASLKKSLSNIKNIQGAKDGLPRLYLLSLRYLKLIDAPLSEEAINSFIQAIDDEKGSRPALSDLFSLEVLMRAALLTLAAEICRDLTEKDKDSANVKSARKLGSIITSLKYITYHRFDKSFESCETEEILLQDPQGSYRYMTNETKAYYRERVAKIATKQKKPESVVAREAVETCKKADQDRDRHIGSYLIPNAHGGRVYLFSLLFFTIILFLLGLTVSPAVLLLFFPLWEAVKQVLDLLFARLYQPAPLPKLELTEIPDGHAVLVVVTTLLSGEKNDKNLFDRLEKIYLSNSGKNIYFGTLCDLCDSDTQTTSKDSVIIQYAEDRISSLNQKYGNRFFLFLRTRTYSKSEKRFMGWERKRGAVIELVRFLKGIDTTFDTTTKSLCIENAPFQSIKYVVTLDADTNLSLDSVLELVGAMMHPLNLPHIDKKKGVVTQGYGIMQPKATPELSAASKTPFSRIMCGVGGIDIYSSASFDLYQTLFGEGIFCGKGIFDKDAFFEVIDQNSEFPEDFILSHDALEGARLRAALISDMELTDGFPKHELSYLKRQHRWVRGDIQNLFFLTKHYRGISGNRVENTIPGISKFKIFDNARRELVPVFSFFSLLLATILPPKAAFLCVFLSILYLLIPFLLDTLAMLTSLGGQCAARRFFSKGVTSGIWQSLLRMLFLISMLPKNAIITLDAVIRSLFRTLISKKKLLEWVTAAQSDNSGKDTLLSFIQNNILEAVIGFLLFVFSPYGIIKLLGLMWFFLPLSSYFTSRDSKNGIHTIDEKEKKRLETYASDIWRFFSNSVNEQENFLPPDNVQIFPIENIAHRTSPTNIGLYLISLLSAKDFGLISSDELYSRLNATLGTIEKLDKWNGHLFNWYNTDDATILAPKYVSSVDSGNFLACAIVLKEGLKDYIHENAALLELFIKLDELINNTDFSCLYNTQRELFSLGVSFDTGEAQLGDGCYDLFMSEARIMSYIAVSARKVPKKHWTKLGRSLISSGGYIGLSSWTGTSFEYFMPPLFLPVPKSSLSYEALSFALRAQRERRVGGAGNGIWGISESGFFAFDCEMNYQYKAFGVPKLGLKRGLDKDLVISPYSSFLAMCVSVKKALVNLRRLYLTGMYGKYGFFEAADYTASRTAGSGAIVKSYMAHHLGMSMAALANARYDGIVVKRFMNNPSMSCGSELLEEKIPVDAIIRKVRTKYDIPDKPSRAPLAQGRVFDNYSLADPRASALSDGRATIILTDTGHLSLQVKDIYINSISSEKYELTKSFFSFFNLGGTCYSMAPLPQNNSGETIDYTFRYAPGVASHELSLKQSLFTVEAKTKYTISRNNASLFRIRTEVSLGKEKGNLDEAYPKTMELAFAFEPIISKIVSYQSHPAFSSLFVFAEYDENENILYYNRRVRHDDENEMICAVALFEKGCSLQFETRKQDVFDTLFSSNSFEKIFQTEPKKNTGACISPYCLIKAVSPELSGHYSAELLCVFGRRKDELAHAIRGARSEHFEDSIKSLEEVSAQLSLSAGLLPKNPPHGHMTAEEKLLSAILFGNGNASPKKHLNGSKEVLWELCISGDLPIVTVNLSSALLIEQLEKYLRAYKLLLLKNIRFDLVILYSDPEKYYRPTENSIVDLITKCRAEGYLKRPLGGIFLVENKQIGANKDTLLAFSSLFLDIFSEVEEEPSMIPLKSVLLPQTEQEKSNHAPIQREGDFRVFGGIFSKDSFLVDKSEPISVPYSHILTGHGFSSLVTQNSLGYTWYSNSHEKRITPFDNDIYEDMHGERLLFFCDGKLYNLIAMSQRVTYSAGKAVYEGTVNHIRYEICVFVSENLPTKSIRVQFFSNEKASAKNSNEKMSLWYVTEPILGRYRSEEKLITYASKGPILTFKNPCSDCLADYTGFLSCRNENGEYTSLGHITEKAQLFSNFGYNAGCKSNCAAIGIQTAVDSIVYFNLGIYRDKEEILKRILDRFKNQYEEECKKAVLFANSLLPDVTCAFSSKADPNIANAVSCMFNFWLPYQNAACRILARSGFYQSGGAYGFRDQLQDILTLMYSKPGMARTHILRAATHQFVEGDVQHWWHHIHNHKSIPSVGSLAGVLSHKGVRSRCSDDYIWLPYTVCNYIKFTGDRGILDIAIRYLEDTPLAPTEHERYSQPKISPVKEPLYQHCVRALELAMTLTGEHGLPLLGTGDWSDGLNRAGKSGKGESVWLAMFLKLTLDEFSVVATQQNDEANAKKFSDFATLLKENVRKHCFDENGSYYIRAYYDDGTPIGKSDCYECKIDLLPQAFCAIAEIENGDLSRLESSNRESYKQLFDKESHIYKLFTPAFKDDSHDPGYIKGYVEGTRENGGQYTHAAVFGVLGLLKSAKMLYAADKQKEAIDFTKMGEDAFLSLFPALRMSTYYGEYELSRNYKTEPYVLTGDIYSNPEHKGRGGWSWYSGAAGWLWRTTLSGLFGITLCNVCTDDIYVKIETERITPLADQLDGAEVTLQFKNAKTVVRYRKSAEKLLLLDNNKTSNNIPLKEGEHTITVCFTE